jgi:hypothetical protein
VPAVAETPRGMLLASGVGWPRSGWIPRGVTSPPRSLEDTSSATTPRRRPISGEALSTKINISLFSRSGCGYRECDRKSHCADLA